jgi:ribonuclease Z
MGTRDFELKVLGTGAALPARGRYPSSHLLNVGGTLHMIDCGEGTQERLREAAINFQRIATVFISHLHGDHYLGLMGLLSSMHLMGRTAPIDVFGPAQLKVIIDIQLQASGTFLRFPFRFHTVPHRTGEVLLDDTKVTVTTLALRHRIPCTGYLFREKPGPHRLRPEAVHRIPHYLRNAVKAGEDLVLPNGERVPNAELTLPPLPARSYAYCSDTAYAPELVEALQRVDLLYHEATFTETMRARAKETFHSTAAQAARIAAAADVGHLLLGHFSSRFKSVDVLLDEARDIFPRTSVASEGDVHKIPSRDPEGIGGSPTFVP